MPAAPSRGASRKARRGRALCFRNTRRSGAGASDARRCVRVRRGRARRACRPAAEVAEGLPGTETGRPSRRSERCRAAAAELDRRAAARRPPATPPSSTGRASIPLAARIDAKDTGARAALADRHHRPVRRQPGPTDREQAVGDVAASGDIPGSRAHRARGRRSPRACSSNRPVVEVADGVDPLDAAAEDKALELEVADRAKAAHRTLRLVVGGGLDDNPLRRQGRGRSRPSRTSPRTPARWSAPWAWPAR